jgi:hypothetical protein
MTKALAALMDLAAAFTDGSVHLPSPAASSPALSPVKVQPAAAVAGSEQARYPLPSRAPLLEELASVDSKPNRPLELEAHPHSGVAEEAREEAKEEEVKEEVKEEEVKEEEAKEEEVKEEEAKEEEAKEEATQAAEAKEEAKEEAEEEAKEEAKEEADASSPKKVFDMPMLTAAAADMDELAVSPAAKPCHAPLGDGAISSNGTAPAERVSCGQERGVGEEEAFGKGHERLAINKGQQCFALGRSPPPPPPQSVS